jgi:hypothetical protein
MEDYDNYVVQRGRKIGEVARMLGDKEPRGTIDTQFRRFQRDDKARAKQAGQKAPPPRRRGRPRKSDS